MKKTIDEYRLHRLRKCMNWCKENKKDELITYLTKKKEEIEKVVIGGEKLDGIIADIDTLLTITLRSDDISGLREYFSNEYNTLYTKFYNKNYQLELPFDIFDESINEPEKPRGVLKREIEYHRHDNIKQGTRKNANNDGQKFEDITINNKDKYLENLGKSCVTITPNSFYMGWSGIDIEFKSPYNDETFGYFIPNIKLTVKEYNSEYPQFKSLRENSETPEGISNFLNSIKNYMKNKNIIIDDQIEDYVNHFFYNYSSCEAGEIAQSIMNLDGTFFINDKLTWERRAKQTAIMLYPHNFTFSTYSPTNQNLCNIRRGVLIRKKQISK